MARFRLLLGIHTLELQANLRLLGLLRHRLQLALVAVPAKAQRLPIRLATTLAGRLAKRPLQPIRLATIHRTLPPRLRQPRSIRQPFSVHRILRQLRSTQL